MNVFWIVVAVLGVLTGLLIFGTLSRIANAIENGNAHFGVGSEDYPIE